ncbi:MAG TPA: SusC/RagA family TonB-linked outer membrane protein, partial [Gemmatimonadales bacterium]|nr:SusC/RagA family TonB-linked outer membrane protein [Gemmatimonadales bacterium]
MTRTLRGLLTLAAAAALAGRAAYAQAPVTVTGRVTSDAGVPLAYAEVRIPSLALGTVTRDNGVYVILVPAARVQGQQVTLLARLVGYRVRTDTITLASGTITHDFALGVNPLQLGEVVVTGAGMVTEAQKLGSVRNAVDSTQIQRSSEMNVVEALAGKAPNVDVVGSAGDPGASSFIRIRGLNTINGSGQPLIVVDGTPIDNSTTTTGGNTGSTVASNRAIDLNPSDIANVEILKGPSAAAIYGARAGQGVILITTKNGQPGPTRTTFRSEVQTLTATNGVPLQRQYGQGTKGVSGTCSTVGCFAASGSWGPTVAPGTPTYDHWNDLFRTGLIADNDLTVSGGDDRTLFYINGEYMHDAGELLGPNNHFQRASARLKASHKLLDNLTIAGNVAYADSRGAFLERGSNVSGLLLGALRTSPTFNNLPFLDPVTGLQRSYRYPLPAANSATLSRGYDNPFFVINDDDATSRVGRVFGNASVSWLPQSWLKIEELVGLDYSNDERLEALAQSSSSFPTGQVTTVDLKHLQIDQNLIATGQHAFSPDFGGTLVLGSNLNDRDDRDLFVTGNGLIAPAPFSLTNTVDRLPPDNNQSIVHTLSFYGQAEADLYDQLYLSAGLRNDGSSTFGASERRNWFPKASVAWEFTKYLNQDNSMFKFLVQPLSFLSYGKARVAYGQSGKEPNVYQTLNSFTTGAFGDGGWGPSVTPTQGGFGGVYSGRVKGQDSLRPERTGEFESGVDLGLFRNQMIDAHFTYYNQKSTDVIFLTPLAPSSGYSLQAQNAATIRNVGYELSLNVRPVETPDLAWNMGFQWGTNDNWVAALRGVDFVTIPGSGFTDPQGGAFVGYPLGELRGTDFVRCGRGIVSAKYGSIDAQCGSAPQGAVYLAPNGFPLEDGQLRPIANPYPDWSGSVQTSVHFKRWTFSGLLDIKHGGQMWNGTKGALTFYGTSANTLVRNVNRTFGKDFYPQFTYAGPGVGKPVYISDSTWYVGGLGSGFTGPSAQFIEPAGYVKLREIAIAYTFSEDWVSRALGFRAIDVRVAGRNLVTWTKYTGID